MATIRQVRQRIRTAKSIQQITKAMKMVAIARFRRAQERVVQARPYAETMRGAMTSLAAAIGGEVQHPLLESRPPRNVGFLIVSADRGLAGSYNSALLRHAHELVGGYERNRLRLYVSGAKAVQYFTRRGFEIATTFQMPGTGPTLTEVRAITARLRNDFESGVIDQVFVVYTKFFSAMTQRPTDAVVLPISQPDGGEGAGAASEDYLFEPDAGTLLQALLPRYLENQIYQALLEATASEHGARMTAMTSATDNAGKMISTLTLQLNRARQAGITREISEIVGGAEALKG